MATELAALCDHLRKNPEEYVQRFEHRALVFYRFEMQKIDTLQIIQVAMAIRNLDSD